jgi:uncharacterized cofD-like protein
MLKEKVKKIVVVGGGTGSYTVLSGLKKYPVDLTAVVTMADDGGSTGRLRDEFGVLPPGDVRQCLVALSDGEEVLRKLFLHRFEKGELKGHNFGNLFISSLEQITGDIQHALEHAGKILKIRGSVLPVTLDKIKLVAELGNGKVLHGENEISDYQLVSRFGIKKFFLKPRAKANPNALKAIKEADVIIVGPGNLYCSLLPNFLITGVTRAMARSSSKKIYVANLMNKHGQTDDFSVSDYVAVIEDKIGKKVFDTVIYNTKTPSPRLVKRYADEGEAVIQDTSKLNERTCVGVPLLANGIGGQKKGDMLRRTLIRHDPDKLAKAIMSVA